MALFQICAHVLMLVMFVTYLCRPDLFVTKHEKSELMTGINMVVWGQMDSDWYKDHHGKGPTDPTKLGATGKQMPRYIDVGVIFKDKRHPNVVSPTFKSPKALPLKADVDIENRPHGSHPFESHGHFKKRGNWSRRENRYMLAVLTLLSLGFSCMLLYGALRERPSYLMPYFCLQVFDFVIACLWVVSYYSYLPEVKLWISANYHLPFRNALLHMDLAWLTFLMMTVGILWLTVKAYFIGMVWACYKFLLRKLNGDLGRPRRHHSPETEGLILISTGPACDEDLEALISNGEASIPLPPPPPGAGVIPPKYEDVLKTPANANMPPPYFRGKFDG